MIRVETLHPELQERLTEAVLDNVRPGQIDRLVKVIMSFRRIGFITMTICTDYNGKLGLCMEESTKVYPLGNADELETFLKKFEPAMENI